ncbi:MAG TPA: Gldg family protein, partial [Lentisphaeria bacterium]|nr:Gldg family protein [Lentisphaeria bacterium]
MSVNKKRLQTYLYSFVGIAAMAVILIIVNLLFRSSNIRFDGTADKLYTLSEGTVKTLKKLDKNVNIRFYYSKDAAQMPVGLKSYASRVEDLLKEYRRHAGKRIQITKLNPKPDSDA